MLVKKVKKKLSRFDYKKPNGISKKYPKVIQLPITYNCDSRCVTCNIWKMSNHEITLKEFSRSMSDPIFKKVEAVGINGGEPSLVEDLEKYIEVVIDQLPLLKQLSFISHGFHTEKLLEKLKVIYKLTKAKGIHFFVSISLDGYKHIHQLVRRYPDAFERTMKSVTSIKNGIGVYADAYEVACTISKINADYLSEFDTFVRKSSLTTKYRMAVDVKRLDNDILYQRYNAFGGYSAREHLYKYVVNTKRIGEKWRYFTIYYSVISRRTKRLAGCHWQDRGITFDAYGNIYYCAVKSDAIGNLLKEDGEKIFFAKENQNHRKEIVKTCDSCSHDYSGKIYYKNYLVFIKYLLFEKYWQLQFKYF